MKRKIDLTRPKDGLREGVETMVYYGQDEHKRSIYRHYFKGYVAKFVVVDQRSETRDGVHGILLELLTASPRAAIYYQAFERTSDGTVFFLGESPTQIVDKSMRNRQAAYLNRFN